jgi:hypothetical protein
MSDFYTKNIQLLLIKYQNNIHQCCCFFSFFLFYCFPLAYNTDNQSVMNVYVERIGRTYTENWELVWRELGLFMSYLGLSMERFGNT